MVAPLLFIVIVGLVVFGLVVGARRLGAIAESGDGVTATIRRLFQYGLLGATVAFVASGLSMLLGEAVNGRAIASDSSNAALALAYLVVGIPAMVGLGWWTRSQHQDAHEAGSTGLGGLPHDCRRRLADNCRGLWDFIPRLGLRECYVAPTAGLVHRVGDCVGGPLVRW